MKTEEELNVLKREFEALNTKLAELTDDELAQVTGGDWQNILKRAGVAAVKTIGLSSPAEMAAFETMGLNLGEPLIGTSVVVKGTTIGGDNK